MEQRATGKPREVSFEAVIIRADGSREDLGTVAYWHANPFMRLWHRIRRRLSTLLGA